MQGIAILLLIVLLICWVGPRIKRWLQRKAMEKAEDYMRQTFGMPPRENSRKSKKRDKKQQETNNRGRTQRPYSSHAGPIIPKEYAEDVEFVEIIDYSSSEIRMEKKGETKIYHESQISDVEWTEIKQSRSK